MIKTASDLKSLGTILGIWAHPDDETFSMGGIITAAVNNGQQVALITATRGEAGVQDENKWPGEQLATIRTEELEAAMKILGVKDHEWLDYPDGGCSTVDEKLAVGQLVQLIEKYQPDSILTFGIDGLTGHPDHQAVSRWVSQACKFASSSFDIYHATLTPKQYEATKEADSELNLFFNIDNPPVCDEKDCDICFVMDENLCRIKLEALRAMPSQYESMDKFFDSSLKISFGTEAFRKM